MPDRLQREIEDLLSKLDTFPRPRPMWARARDAIARGLRRFVNAIHLPHISAGHILLLGITLIVIAYVGAPGDADITRWFIVGGIVLFVAAFLMSMRRQARPPEKRWRGEPMELSGTRVSNRLRSWWGRWRSRR